MADVPTFAELSQKLYKEQAIWFLNGFWNEGASTEAEHVWDSCAKFVELDPRGAEGNELNEFDSHRILEGYDETMSAIKMREAMREIDVDSNKHMSLIEYLIWRYKKTVDACINSPQGDNAEEVAACQAQLDEVQTALNDVLAKLAAQKEAAAANAAALDAQRTAVAENEAAVAANDAKVKQQQAAVAEADTALSAARSAEDEVRSAEAELEAALAELKAQEDAYNSKIAELEAKSSDTSVGVVTRNKAANELSQMKSEDPLPLRKAKITQEAALRRVQKARAAAEAATAEADAKKTALEAVQAELEATQAALEEAQRQLEQKQAELEEAQRQLEAAVAELESAFAELEVKMAEAEAALAAAKAKPGVAHGFFWWSGRTLYRSDESLPRAKQKYDHAKPFFYDENQ